MAISREFHGSTTMWWIVRLAMFEKAMDPWVSQAGSQLRLETNSQLEWKCNE